MSRRSFLAGSPAGVLPFGHGGRYAAFSCQGLIHSFRRYLAAKALEGLGVSLQANRIQVEETVA
jgi:hypothetical protein